MQGELRGGEDVRKLALERGDDLADGLSGASRRGDDVVANGTSTTPVLLRRSIDGLLGRGRRVHGGHQTLNDAEVVVDDLREGREAVGRARRVRDHGELGVVLLEVDADDEHRGIGGGRGDDDLLGTALEVSGGPARSGSVRMRRERGGEGKTHFSMVVKTPVDSTM